MSHLQSAVAVVSSLMVSPLISTLRTVSTLAAFGVFIGAIMVGLAFPAYYMVAFDGVRPGDSMWMDTLAPTKQEALHPVVLGAAVLVFSGTVRFICRKILHREQILRSTGAKAA